jgi:hypothetical protein
VWLDASWFAIRQTGMGRERDGWREAISRGEAYFTVVRPSRRNKRHKGAARDVAIIRVIGANPSACRVRRETSHSECKQVWAAGSLACALGMFKRWPFGTCKAIAARGALFSE